MTGARWDRTRAMAALAACAVGCSGGGTPTPPIEVPVAQVSSGRLRARFLAGPNGLRIPSGWVDTQLNTPCRMQASPANDLRCLPDPALLGASGGQLYADAACTSPAIDVFPFCPGAYGALPPFVLDASASPLRYLPVTGSLAAGAQSYILKPDCIASQTLMHGYSVGAPVPVAAFALASVPTPPTGSPRLQPLYRTAEDTSQELIGIQDTARGERCAPQIAADGQLRCLPDGVYPAGNTYADPACTRIAVPPPASFALPSTAYTMVTIGGCPAQHIYTLGNQTTMGILYLRLDDGTCLADPGGPVDIIVGDEIPASEFVPLTPRDVGTGRVRERVLVDDTGRAVARGYAWIDSRLNAAVYPESIDGHSYALVPQGTNMPVSGFYFFDAACTHPQDLVEISAVTCGPPVTSGYTVTPGSTLGACTPPQVRALGAAVDTSRLYSLATGSCAPLEGTKPQLRPVGAPVALSTFETVTVSSE